MNDESPPRARSDAPTFARTVGRKAARKLAAQRDPVQVWFGLGMMGAVGWSVAVPTVVGAAVGRWIEARHAGHSWTLALLVAGLVVGCLNAWRWVAGESRTMRESARAHEESPE